jgi:hypothetical protein
MEDENVRSILENVCDEMCNNYCKYKEESWKALERGEILYACEHCPLRRLA